MNYAQNHKDTLRNYLKDVRSELSNNCAERKAKSYAIGRKNSLFHTSVDGAVASSIMYSLVETAKANKLNVFQYIYTLLLYMPGYKDRSEGIEQLLPWSDFIDVKGEPLEHYLARQITPDIGFSFHEFTIDDKRVVVLVIPAAKNVPTAFNNIRFLRIGSSKVNLNKYPERESQLFDILRNGLPTIESVEAYDQDTVAH